MIRRPPRSTRTDTLFPYTTLSRSRHFGGGGRRQRQVRALLVQIEDQIGAILRVGKPGKGHLGAVGELARAREPRIERVEGPRSADRFQRVGEGEAAPAGRDLVTARPEARRVGKACLSTCRSRWS